jgi:hypothetical protein
MRLSRTSYTLIAAGLLAIVSVGILLLRRQVLGAEINGPRGASTWRITLQVRGPLPEEPEALVLLPPLDFRQQHIYEERLDSAELTPRMVHGRLSGRREIVWQRRRPQGTAQFQITYSFTCALGMWPPTPGMERLTEAIDAPPASSAPHRHMPLGKRTFLRPAPRVESEHPEIQALAQRLVAGQTAPADQLRALFQYVRRLAHRPASTEQSALECLRSQGGSSAGRARLLVALCRNRGIPARLVTGLVLDRHGPHDWHYWAEAWVNHYWLPLCPVFGHFGAAAFPRHYLIWNLGEEDVLRVRQPPVQTHLVAEQLEQDEPAPAALPPWWPHWSLYRLRPAEQQLVRFLLLLPLAALLVSVFRVGIGLPTFGTFAPALLGLAFPDWHVLPWGLLLFLVLVLAGWGFRHLLDYLHLLQVPRAAALLTLLVLLLISGIVLADQFGLPATSYFGLLPLVILTHLIERFWTVEAEDGTAASFKTLAGTFVIAATVSLALSPPAVATWMFRYPETLGLVLAGQLLLGRYTGYRLTELYRFQDLIQEDCGGEHVDLVDTLAPAAGARHPGDEPPQHHLHPRPESPAPLPPGGQQTAPGGTVPADRRP